MTQADELKRESWIKRTFNWIWSYLEVLCWYSVAGLIGWAVVVVFRIGVEGSIAMALTVFVCIVAACIVPSALALRKPDRAKTLSRGSLISFGAFLLLTLIGPALLPRPSYAFLPQPKMMSLNPGVMGIGWDVYNYQANLEEVMKSARAELEAKGFKCENLRFKGKPYEPNLECYLPSNDPDSRFNETVSISGGRVDGSHFFIDGDFLDSQPMPGWVIVQVSFVDKFWSVRLCLGDR